RHSVALRLLSDGPRLPSRGGPRWDSVRWPERHLARKCHHYLRRCRQSEHGLSLVAIGYFYPHLAQRAARRVAGKPGKGRRSYLPARLRCSAESKRTELCDRTDLLLGSRRAKRS